jgi:hypothetical protein
LSAMDLGRFDRVTEVQGPRAYEVRTGKRYLHGLEDGEVRHWPEYHLFVLDERTGSIMIEGGYGTFSYGWASRGRDCSLHAFLYDLDFDYFMKKASKTPHMVFDGQRTIDGMRSYVIEARKEGALTRREAADIWFDIDHEIDGCTHDEQEFWRAFERCGSALHDLFCDGGPSIRTKEHAGMRRFWDEVWQAFRGQVLHQHWLDHIAKTPLPRRRAIVVRDSVARAA